MKNVFSGSHAGCCTSGIGTPFHHEEADQFEVVQAGNLVFERGRAACGKQTIDVALLLLLDDGVDGIPEEAGVKVHFEAILRLAVELPAKLLNWLRAAFAEQPDRVKDFLRLKMVAEHLTILADVGHVERMKQILFVEVDAGIDVSQDEDHAGRAILRSGHHGMKPVGNLVAVRVMLYIVQQVEPEFIQAEVHDVDARVHLLQVDDFLLETFELLTAVFEVALVIVVDRVVVACGRDVGELHPVLDAFLEVDVVVERHVRPVVHELDAGVLAADTVDTPETLDDANGIPVDVVVDQIVAVLKVLAFGNAVRGD